MYHSYVMGMDDSIYELQDQGFAIERDWESFMVSFPNEKAYIWEAFVCAHLMPGYWNEYITNNGVVVFLFNIDGVISRYEVYFYENADVLALCERLCECKFDSIYSMLKGNHFYSRYI